jgi:hypothetical protein
MQKRVLWGIALLCLNVFPQYIYESNQSLIDLNNHTGVTYLTSSDDGVSSAFNLGFDFTFYDQTFSAARMATNGCLHFGSSGNHCNDYTPDPLARYNYTIYPFWTDLIAADGNAKMIAKNFNDKIVFGWYKMQEYYRQSSYNSFEVILWNNNSFDIRYGDLDVVQHDVLIGQQGSSTETYTYYFHDECNTGSTNSSNCYNYDWNASDKNANLEGGGSLYYEVIDCSNPLNDTSCAGYEDAYLAQQCDIDALYSTSCDGYADAYLSQQCSMDSLYSTSCNGYEEAYLSQQCDIDSLYSTECIGYEEAFFEQQCSLDSLYDTSCTGYDEAYHEFQCNEDSQYSPTCSGYIPEASFVAIQVSPMEYEIFEIEESSSVVEEIYIQETFVEEVYEPEIIEEIFFDPVDDVIDYSEPIDVIDIFDAEELMDAFVLEETIETIEEYQDEPMIEEVIEEETTEEIVEIAEEIIEEEIVEEAIEEVVEQEVVGNSINKALAVVAQTMVIANQSYMTQNNAGNIDTTQSTPNQTSSAFGASTSNSPSISDQILSASVQTNTVLSLDTSIDALSDNSVIITPLFTLDDTVMADVQVNNLQDQIMSATSNAMTASEADKIANQILANNLKETQESMDDEQEETGEYADETLFINYLGYVPGFNAYKNILIPDQPSWYESKVIYNDAKIEDNTSAYYNLTNENINKLQTIIQSQVNL